MGIKKLQIVSIFSLLVFACIMTGCAREVTRAKLGKNRDVSSPINVILVTISTLRADHVGCLGYHRDTTPNFDGFARQNLLFRNAFATSGWMMPAYGSVITSLYPSRHGATHIEKKLGPQHYTLAEILKDNGYYCVGFCCNPRLSNENGYAADR